MSEQQHSVQTILAEALEIEDLPQRATFLAQACGGDPVLRKEVEELLHAHAGATQFLPEQPAARRIGPDLFRSAGPNLAHPGSEERITEAPGDWIGRYKLLQQIGEGGCGVVYMAEQEEPVRRRVALKVIKLGMDTKSVVARFEAERQALALMDHPNIARVFDAGATEGGRPFFVMELVRGTKITDYCDQNRLSTTARLELFIQVCQAIQHAHQKGIIHRDLKPSNILITVNDDVPVPKVIDFGIAKATEGRLTDHTVFTVFDQFLGTPAYMSPEQAAMTSLDIDTRSDIYSLGVLLYELLAGRTPFGTQALLSAGLDEMRRTILEKEPVRPSTRLRALPVEEQTTTAKRRQSDPPALIHLLRGDLDWIVMKCLEKDRARRYTTASGLAMDIHRHLAHEPVLARPPGRLYRLGKLARRNKLAFAATGAVTVALVAGTAVSTWEAVAARRAREAEKIERLSAQRERDRANLARQRAEEERLRADQESATAKRHLYIANMNLAQQAWDQNNVGRVRQLLAETSAYPDRGFEWYYWQQKTHLELRTLRGSLGPVFAVAYSPDGQRIATSNRDMTASVWDAESGQELHILKGHIATIVSLAFSPDGARIVTGSADQTARVWDAVTGQQLLTLQGHAGRIWSVAVSRNGQRIATAGTDQTATVWDAVTGQEIVTFKGHTHQIDSVAFSPASDRIVTGCRDQTARVWDTATGRTILTLNGHSGAVYAAFSPDGRRIVTGADQTARVWDSATGRELLTLKGHTGRILSVAFSPDGRRILSAGSDTVAKGGDAAKGQELLTLQGHSAAVWSAAFSPDGQQIVTGSDDGTAKVWDLAGPPEFSRLERRNGPFRSVAFSPDGLRIATGSRDPTGRVWDVRSGKHLFFLRGHLAEINSVAYSRDGRRIVTGSYDETAKVWDAAGGRELLTLKGHDAQINSVAFSKDGQIIVSASSDQTARIWAAGSGKELRTLKGHGGAVLSVAISPDGQRILTGSVDQTARIWDVASGNELRTLKGHSGWIRSVSFSPDGQRIVTGSADQTAKLWEAASGRELATLKGHGDQIDCAVFSPDGQRILTGSADQTAKLWDTASGLEYLTLKAHGGRVWTAAFSSDGKHVVTGSWDQTARLWKAATLEQVTLWRQEEQSAEEYRSAQIRKGTLETERARAQRAQDPGAITQWLVLLSIPYEGMNGTEALRQEQLTQESQLRPRAGDRVKTARGELTWRAVRLEDYQIDFNQLLNETTEFNVAYAVCYLRSEADQTGLLMKVASDEEARVYLNGKLLFENALPRPYIPDQDTVAGVELKAGTNVLVFKVVNEVLGWQGSIRFTDATGQPVKGISVSLAPPDQ